MGIFKKLRVSYERLPNEDPAGAGTVPTRIQNFWEALSQCGIFRKDDRKVVLEENRKIEGREREALIEIRLHRNYQYDKKEKCWILSVAVKQLDFGIVNSCKNCSESVTPCKKCEDDMPFIHIVGIHVKPNLPAGTIVQNVLGDPRNEPEPVKVTSGQNVAHQIPVNPKNAAVTVQYVKSVTVDQHTHGWDFARQPFKGEAWITWTWQISTWEDGQKLNLRKRLPVPFKELPVDPRHVQVHPESLVEKKVGGQWHIKGVRKPHVRHVTFDVELEVRIAVLKKSWTMGCNVKDAALLSCKRPGLKLR